MTTWLKRVVAWWRTPEPSRPRPMPMAIRGQVIAVDETTHRQQSRAWFPRQRLQTRFR